MTAHRATWHPHRKVLGFLVAPPATARVLRLCSGIAAREGYGGVVVAAYPETRADASVLDGLPPDVVVAWGRAVSAHGGVADWTLGKLHEGGHTVWRMGARGWPAPSAGAPLVRVE